MALSEAALQQRLGPRVALRGLIRYGGGFATRGLRLTQFLVAISQPEQRQGFLDDEDGTMARFGLDAHEQALVRARDSVGLLQAGAHVYAVAKACHVFGNTLMDIGAAQRGLGTAELVAWLRARAAASAGGATGEAAAGAAAPGEP